MDNAMTVSPTIARAIGAVVVAAAAVGLAYRLAPTTSAFVLATYALLFLFFAYLVALFRGSARDVALAAASLVLGLGAVEVAALFLAGSATTLLDKDEYTGDESLGWRLARPGVFREQILAADGKPIIDFVATIDTDLTRKVVSSKSGPLVAFLGDSFTFGLGVPDAETLPQAFADTTDRRFHVMNLAVSGYGPQQFLRTLELDDFRLSRNVAPRLFVMLTSPWHAARTSCKAAFSAGGPRFVLRDGEAALAGRCPQAYERDPAYLRPILAAARATASYKYFVGVREEPIESADIDLYVAILAKAGKVAREKYGAPTLILFLADDLTSPQYRLGQATAMTIFFAGSRKAGRSRSTRRSIRRPIPGRL